MDGWAMHRRGRVWESETVNENEMGMGMIHDDG